MGGVSGIVKAAKPTGGLKGLLEMGRPGSKTDIKRQKGIWNATMKPQPAEQQDTGGPSGPVIGAMSEEEQEEVRKRRAQRNRPQTTALTTGQSDTLGG